MTKLEIDWEGVLEAARAIAARLTQHGHTAWFAGGCVRDLILGQPPKDVDIATSARPGEVEELFETTIPVGKDFGVIIVRSGGVNFEVATFRSDGEYMDGRRPCEVHFSEARDDAQRRDFTINGLFLDPATGDVFDHVGGIDDLARKLVRTIGEPGDRFNEDALRLLRAIRFAARFDFEIEEATLASIKSQCDRIKLVSRERVGQEIVKMLTQPQPRRAMELLRETGLLRAVLPEVAAMEGVEQPPKFHPEGDVWVHTMLMLDDLPAGPSPTLALGALLHDVGKPPTYEELDRIRFNHHPKVGASIARDICHRLRLSKAIIDRVEYLVSSHMRFMDAPKMRNSTFKRFVREEGFTELVTLYEIDCRASHGDKAVVKEVLDRIAAIPPESIKPEPLLRGDDLVKMGFAPGPIFSEILKEVEDAQLDGKISSREEAVEFVEGRFRGN
ncbi:CCA tRNA nucleotidyltransferase [Candidatus Hydrogenedentota bacterium]